MHDRDVARALDLEYDLARAFGGDRNLVQQVDRDFGYSLDRAFARVSEHFLGYSFSRMLTRASEISTGIEKFSDLSEIFAKAFTDVAAVGTTDYSISPDLLASDTRKAINELNAQLQKDDLNSTQWAGKLSSRFERLAQGVLARTQVVAGPVASGLRVMALCLAVEADANQSHGLGEAFRQIAAEITWLEMRHTGREASIETVVLALS